MQVRDTHTCKYLPKRTGATRNVWQDTSTSLASKDGQDTEASDGLGAGGDSGTYAEEGTIDDDDDAEWSKGDAEHAEKGDDTYAEEWEVDGDAAWEAQDQRAVRDAQGKGDAEYDVLADAELKDVGNVVEYLHVESTQVDGNEEAELAGQDETYDSGGIEGHNEEWPAVADILPAWPDDEVGEDKANNGGGIGNQDEDWPAVADVLPTWPEDCEMWEGKSGAGMDFDEQKEEWSAAVHVEPECEPDFVAAIAASLFEKKDLNN